MLKLRTDPAARASLLTRLEIVRGTAQETAG